MRVTRCMAFRLPAFLGFLIALGTLAAGPNDISLRQSNAVQRTRAIVFVENHGQAPSDVLWEAHGSGFEASFGRDYFVFRTFAGTTATTGELAPSAKGPSAFPPLRPEHRFHMDPVDQRISLLKANPHAVLSPLDRQPGKLNFFRGNHPEHWHGGLSTYARLRYANIYPGIDLLFYGHEGSLEYDFVVAPGSDPHAIRLRVEDHTSRITERGELQAGDGPQAVLHRPLLYQNTDKGKRVIEGRFTRLDRGEIGFQFAQYDASKTLVIDPSLSLLYSTYLGGPHDDQPASIALDAHNNIYMLGYSGSEDYPVTSNAYQPARKRLGVLVNNLVITKISPSGSLLFSTFLGGSTGESAGGIVVDSQGRAYISGVTKSADFPVTPGANQKTFAAGAPNSAFLSEIGSDGSTLLYSSFFGGAGGASAIGLKLSSQGSVYLFGSAGPGLPTTSNAFLKQISSGNAGFVSLFNLAGSGAAQLVAATYYGAVVPAPNSVVSGNGVHSLALDASDNPWIVGQTWTNNLPTTPNALQATLPPLDPGCNGAARPLNSAAFAAKLSADLSTLVYGSYLSGQVTAPVAYCSEYAHSVKIDSAGNLYIGGTTASNKFPVSQGAFQPAYPGGGFVEFVSKLSPDGTAILWSSYLGGGGPSFLSALAPDSSGNVWIGGAVTRGSAGTFPVSADAYQPLLKGGSDGNITEFSNDGTRILYSTLLGGSGDDAILDVALDAQGTVYAVGSTNSRDFPVSTNAFQSNFANGDPVYDGSDIFVTVFGAGTIGAISPLSGGNAGDTTINVSGAGFQKGATCSLELADNRTIQASAVTISSGGTSMTCTFALNGAATGSYRVVVTNADGTAFTSQQAFQVNLGGSPNVWANLVGRSKIRTGVPSTFFVNAGNSGDSDALFTILWLMLDPNLTYTLPGGILSASGKVSVDFQSADAVTDLATGFHYVGFLIPLLKPGDVASFPVQVTAAKNESVLTLAAFTQPPWFQSRAAALAELAAYGSANPAQIPAACQPPNSGASTQDCAGLWIKEIASAAANADIEQSPIVGKGNPANNPSTLQSYIANVVTGLEGSLGVLSANPVDLPVLQTSGIPFIALESAGLYLAGIGYGLYSTPNPGTLPAVRGLPPRTFGCFANSAGSWVNTDSTCAGTVLTRDWEQSYTGVNILLQQCSGTNYATTSTFFGACDPWPFPHPQPNLPCQDMPTANLRGKLRNGRGLKPRDGQSCSSSGGAIDPNDKSGPIGDGSSAAYITGNKPLNYNVAFENQPSATLPAAQVVVSDQLDPAKVDITTVTLGTIAFGANIIALPGGTSSYNTTYKLNSSLSVRIQGSLNPDTGLLKWTFTTLDPATGLPPSDPTAGFLPPDVDGIRGQGSVVFSVMPKSGLATGTEIANQATVVFDANAPINTPIWLNTIDRDAPSSSVSALPADENQATFNVAWSGTDKGSGIRSYNIYVSDNGGPFSVWQSGVSASSAAFTAQPGHTYGFYSISTDGAGNVEAAKNLADTMTTVSATAAGTGPAISAAVNGASFQPGPLSGGAIFSIFGANLASGISGAEALPLPTQLGGVSITLNGLPVPLIYVGPNQINAQVPYGILNGSASMVLTLGNTVASPVSVQIGDVSPGLFLADGQYAAAQNQDFSANSPSNPAAPGSVLQVYFTGQGVLDLDIATGAASPGSPPANVVAATTATIGGQDATVIFSGMTPGTAGLAQANIIVPNLAPGDYPLVLMVGGVAANSGMVSVGPVP